MQARYEDFQKLDVEILAISSGSVEEHKALADKIGATFPILSDAEGKVIESWGLLHPGALPFTDLPVARPAIYLVDWKGRIRQRWLTDNWRIRVRPDDLLRTIREIQLGPSRLRR